MHIHTRECDVMFGSVGVVDGQEKYIKNRRRMHNNGEHFAAKGFTGVVRIRCNGASLILQGWFSLLQWLRYITYVPNEYMSIWSSHYQLFIWKIHGKHCKHQSELTRHLSEHYPFRLDPRMQLQHEPDGDPIIWLNCPSCRLSQVLAQFNTETQRK